MAVRCVGGTVLGPGEGGPGGQETRNGMLRGEVTHRLGSAREHPTPTRKPRSGDARDSANKTLAHGPRGSALRFLLPSCSSENMHSTTLNSQGAGNVHCYFSTPRWRSRDCPGAVSPQVARMTPRLPTSAPHVILAAGENPPFLGWLGHRVGTSRALPSDLRLQ